MRVLGVDLGERLTGFAWFEEQVGFPFPLDPHPHLSSVPADVALDVAAVARTRGADVIVIGLPLLPSGLEGEQAEWVRAVVTHLLSDNLVVQLLDERYTTPRHGEGQADGTAALEILRMFLARTGRLSPEQER
jgi:putative holliday junction resolvase